MYYSGFGLLSLILHLIINHEALKKKDTETTPVSMIRYRQFLIGIMIYYISDILWGFLEELRIIPLVYTDTVIYFLSMSSSVLLWTRYVVEYIGRKASRSKALIYAGHGIFSFIVLHLVVNFFNPVIFVFTKQDGYIPGTARYIIFSLLFLLHMILSIYSFIVSTKTENSDMIHYRTVSASGAVMAVFIVLQTMYPLLPFYAIGLLVSTCILHVFVEEDEKMETDRRLRSVEQIAEWEHEKKEKAEKALKETKKTHVTFGQIAEGLASNYDVIYYVDTADGNYVGYTSHNIFGQLEIDKSGDDFFEESKKNIRIVVHPQDVERMTEFMDRDHLLSALEDRKQISTEYRLIVSDSARYTRLSIRKTSDSRHFIIGVENIDDEIMKEKEHLKALNTEKELARRDELTGTKNKMAYSELEQSIQNNMDNGVDYLPFAVTVCDINDLKKVNDSEGHKAGDDYIKSAAKMLCDIFAHSPVFRIGGDEFVIFLSGDDYNSRELLMLKLHEQVMENILNEQGPIIASGISDFIPGKDMRLSDVFERADNAMYNDKRELKHHCGG